MLAAGCYGPVSAPCSSESARRRSGKKGDCWAFTGGWAVTLAKGCDTPVSARVLLRTGRLGGGALRGGAAELSLVAARRR